MLPIVAPAWLAATTWATGGGDTTGRGGVGTVGGVVAAAGAVTGGVGVTFGATRVEVVDPAVSGAATVPVTAASPVGGGVVTAGVVLAPKAALGATIIEHATKRTPVRTAPLRKVDRG